jgi:hypothetical protein
LEQQIRSLQAQATRVISIRLLTVELHGKDKEKNRLARLAN